MIAAVLLGAIALQEAPTAPAVPPPVATVTVDRAAARLARIEREKAALATELVAIEKHGRVPEFRAALEELEKKYSEIEIGKERWAPFGERGFIPMLSVDRALEWGRPARGREPELAVDFAVEGHPGPVIVDLVRQLEGQGVEFLLVLFPSRIQLEPELVLPDDPKSAEAAPFHGMVGPTNRFLAELAAQGVEIVDLAPPFVAARDVELPDGCARGLYLSRNQHWTPRAAELAAKVVADRIREMPCFTPGPVTEGNQFTLFPHAIDFGSTAGGQAPDSTPEHLWMNAVRPKGKPISPAAKRDSPIVVFGDSFADFYDPQSASFADQLTRFTGHPIDLIAPKGGAESQCRDAFARRHKPLRGKQVVIWLMQVGNLRPLPAYHAIDVVGGS